MDILPRSGPATARPAECIWRKVKGGTFENGVFGIWSDAKFVRATGSGVWYLNDPIEDNPNHAGRINSATGECPLVRRCSAGGSQFEGDRPLPERIFRGALSTVAEAEEARRFRRLRRSNVQR